MADGKRYHRRSIRWVGHNYARAGAYFVTICTRGHVCLFGQVVDGVMCPNPAGRVAEACWRAIPEHFPEVELDAFIVMPNHVHGVLMILPLNDSIAANCVGANNDSPVRCAGDRRRRPRGTARTVGSIVRGFKIGVTQWMRLNTAVRDVWQRNYYEHVVRDRCALHHIRRYISDNPASWLTDEENPARWLAGSDGRGQ